MPYLRSASFALNKQHESDRRASCKHIHGECGASGRGAIERLSGDTVDASARVWARRPRQVRQFIASLGPALITGALISNDLIDMKLSRTV